MADARRIEGLAHRVKERTLTAVGQLGQGQVCVITLAQERSAITVGKEQIGHKPFQITHGHMHPAPSNRVERWPAAVAHAVVVALQQYPVALAVAALKRTLRTAWQHRRIGQLVEDIVHQSAAQRVAVAEVQHDHIGDGQIGLTYRSRLPPSPAVVPAWSGAKSG